MVDLTKRQFIEKLREEKLKQDSPDLRNALTLLSKELYSDDVHFVMELVQNAEDNDYPEGTTPKLRFELQNSVLTILNNEIGFTEQNVKSICSVGASTKREHTKGYIGEKGIGFKSVFKVTDRPEIHSAGFHFRFDGETKIIPEWQETETEGKTWTTQIILPLKSEQVQRVRDELLGLDPSLLLFLDKLQEIEIVCGGQTRHLSLQRLDSARVEVSADGCKERWLVYKKVCDVPEQIMAAEERRKGVTVREFGLAFPVDESWKLESRGPQKVFAFLPTQLVPGLRFRVQADFILNTDRSDLLRDRLWNKWCASTVAETYQEAVHDLCRSEPGFLLTHLNVAPTPDQIDDPFFQPIAATTGNLLPNIECVPDESMTPQLPARVVKAGDAERKLFPGTDLDEILGGSTYEGLAYTHSQMRCPEPVAKAIRLDSFGKPHVLAALSNRTWLSRQSIDWFADLYLHLSHSEYNTSDVNGKDILVLQGAQLRLTKVGENAVFFLPDQERKTDTYALDKLGLKFINRELTWEPRDDTALRERNQEIRRWLGKLGVGRLDEPANVVSSAFVPALKNGVFASLADDELLGLTQYLKENWQKIIEGLDQNKMEVLKHKLPLLCTSLNGSTVERAAASDLYLLEPYSEQRQLIELLTHVPDAKKVSSRYFDRDWERLAVRNRDNMLKGWREFFSELGCHSLFKITPRKWWPANTERRLWYTDKGRSDELDPDYVSNDIDTLFETIHNSPEDGYNLALKLLDYLDGHWPKYSEKFGPSWPNATWRYHYYRPYSEQVPSTLLDQLRNSRWCPGSDHRCHRPSELVCDTPANRRDDPQACFLASKIKNEELIETLGFQQDVGIEGLLRSLRELRETADVEEARKRAPQMFRRLSEILEREPTRLKTVVETFTIEKLVFCPSLAGNWHSPSETRWAGPQTDSIAGIPILEHVYDPSLKSFFVERLQVPSEITAEELVRAWLKLPMGAPQPEDAQATISWIYESLAQLQEFPDGLPEDVRSELVTGEYFLTINGRFICASCAVVPDDEVIAAAFDGSGIEIIWIPRLRPEKRQAIISALLQILPLRISEAECTVRASDMTHQFPDHEKIELAQRALARFLASTSASEWDAVISTSAATSFFGATVVGAESFLVDLQMTVGKKTFNGILSDAAAYCNGNRLYVLLSNGRIGKTMNELSADLLRCIGVEGHHPACDRIANLLLSYDNPKERQLVLDKWGLSDLTEEEYRQLCRLDQPEVQTVPRADSTIEVATAETETARHLELFDRPLRRTAPYGSNQFLKQRFPVDADVAEFVAMDRQEEPETEPAKPRRRSEKQFFTFALRQSHLESGYLPFPEHLLALVPETESIVRLSLDATDTELLLSLKCSENGDVLLAAASDASGGCSSFQEFVSALLEWPPGTILTMEATTTPGLFSLSAEAVETDLSGVVAWELADDGRPNKLVLEKLTLPYRVDPEVYRAEFALADKDAIETLAATAREEGKGGVLDTVYDVVREMDRDGDLPASFEEILKHVLGRRPCAAASVRAMLAGYKCFRRQPDGRWCFDSDAGLVQRCGVQALREMSSTTQGTEHPRTPSDEGPRQETSSEQQTTSGIPVNADLAKQFLVRAEQVFKWFTAQLVLLEPDRVESVIDAFEKACKHALVGTSYQSQPSEPTRAQGPGRVQSHEDQLDPIRIRRLAESLHQDGGSRERLRELLHDEFLKALRAGESPFKLPAVKVALNASQKQFLRAVAIPLLRSIVDELVELNELTEAWTAIDAVLSAAVPLEQRHVEKLTKLQGAISHFDEAKRTADPVRRRELLEVPAEHWESARKLLAETTSTIDKQHKKTFGTAVAAKDWISAAQLYLDNSFGSSPAGADAPDVRAVVKNLLLIGSELCDSGQWADAATHLELACRCKQKASPKWPDSDDSTWQGLDMLADCLSALGAHSECFMLWCQILAIAKAHRDQDLESDISSKLLDSASKIGLASIAAGMLSAAPLVASSKNEDGADPNALERLRTARSRWNCADLICQDCWDDIESRIEFDIEYRR